MRRPNVKGVLLAFAAAFALGLTGCNTMKGVGKDMESAGEAIQDAAD
ncbi:MAG: entericidin A/B family lipoprotein [Phycisphaeraceae bacterium]|nr:entericidin A/B family lipoprotein [Phycisphaeraceae bacterium]MCW5767590.1 entericidin A/B family lipoprotein [Phycisphaeraceae bacterium]